MIDRRRTKDSMIEWLSGQPFDFHLTFNFHSRHQLDINYARTKLRRWSCLVLRRLFGRRYYLLDQTQTLFYVAFPEFGASGDNLHLHAPCRVDASKTDEFRFVAEVLWKKVVPSGSLCVQPLRAGADNLLRVAGYDTKDFRLDTDFILSLEFAPAK